MNAYMLALLAPMFVPGQTADAPPLSLEQKAAVFQADMEARFLLDGQALCKLKLPGPGRDFTAYNMPDNAYMTGIYVGTLAMKYAVTGAEADRAAARKSLAALRLLCNVSGGNGLLARAAWPADRPMDDDGIWRDSPCGKYRWRGDVSTDQVAGVMFGFALAYELVADDEERAHIAADARAITDHIIRNDMRIVDIDGKPTRWGRYDPDYVSRREKMNALLLLQVLKVTAHVSGHAYYAELYRHWAVDRGYAAIAVEARRLANPVLRGAVNHSDDVLLYLAYVPLLRLETEPDLRDAYARSCLRTWQGNDRAPGVAPEANPFYAFVMAGNAALFPESAAAGFDVNAAKATLRYFPFDMKWNQDTLAAYRERFGLGPEPAAPDGELRSGGPIPIHLREKTWSAWVQDPYHSAGSRDQDIPLEFNGHDYLLGYWTGRYYGLIRPGE